MNILLRYFGYAVVPLSLLFGGCAGHTSRSAAPPPESIAEQPETPQVGANPVEPPTAQPQAATPTPSGTTPAPSGTTPAARGTTPAASGTTPAPRSTTPAPSATTAEPGGTTPAPKPPSTAPPVKKTPAAKAPAPQPKPVAPTAASAPAPAAPAPLDLAALKEQLKGTKAIGVFTKISLKNQVDDLMKKFGDYYQGRAKTTMPELRQSYDLLIMKVVSLLQDSDSKLAFEVVSSREAIWALLSDRKKFATLQS